MYTVHHTIHREAQEKYSSLYTPKKMFRVCSNDYGEFRSVNDAWVKYENGEMQSEKY